MFTGLRDSYVLLALIALLPGAISWWSGRRLARLADDPALPALFAAHGRRNGGMALIAMVGVGCMGSWTLLVLAVPLVFAGLIASAYPLRRVLFHETWSFGSYCGFHFRLIAGIFGFWIALVAMPSLAGLAGKWDWLAAGGLAGVLVVWNYYYAVVARFCLRARPVAEGEFLSRCRALADACGVPQPRFERIELGGGVIANALALPSLRTSSVLFTETLLDRLDQQEALAICAHELAHFEHYTPRLLRRLHLVTYALIALGAAYAPVTRLAGFDFGPLPVLIWLGAFFASIAVRARDKQRQETACDLRAVELTRDADALIRGLTKLYAIARIPRRIDGQTDRAATHPSLARRIRDIRKAAGIAPVELIGAQNFTGADGCAVVTFDDTGVRWVERDAVTHSLSYSQLKELRVDAKWGGSRLVALEAGARRREMPLAGSDVARLQAVLDVVDGRLAEPPRPPAIPSGIQRAAVLMAAALILGLSQFTVAFVAFLAWLKPSVPLLVGAGLAALTAAGLVLRDYPGAMYATVMSLPLTLIGLLLLAFAWSHRHDARHGVRPYIALLGVLAGLAVAALMMNGLDPVRLHQSARTLPSATVLFVALAGALACSTVRRERLAAAAIGIVALATTVAASPAFLYLVAADPFLVHGPGLELVSIRAAAVGEFDVPSGTSRVDLSPSGGHVAAFQDADGEGASSTFQVGRTGGTLTSIAADDVAFVDDDRLLVVRSDARGTTLKTVRLGGPSRDVTWQLFVPDVSGPSLSFDRPTGRWRLTGRGGDESIVRVEGSVGVPDVQRRRWPAEDSFGGFGFVEALTTAGPEMLVFETRYDRTPLAHVIPWRWTLRLLQPFNQVSRYATVGDRGRRTFGESKLAVECLADVLDVLDVLDDGGLACTVHDGTRTHIVTIEAGTGHVEGIGWLDGRFVGDRHVVRGWLTGWAGSRPVAIRLATGQVLHMPKWAGAVSSLTAGSDRIAAILLADSHFTVRVYPLPPATPNAELMRAQRTPGR